MLHCSFTVPHLYLNTVPSVPHREAVEHYLSALNLQQHSSRGAPGQRAVTSDTIWSTLRMAIALLGRPELQTAVDARDLDTLNREFGTGT